MNVGHAPKPDMQQTLPPCKQRFKSLRHIQPKNIILNNHTCFANSDSHSAVTVLLKFKVTVATGVNIWLSQKILNKLQPVGHVEKDSKKTKSVYYHQTFFDTDIHYLLFCCTYTSNSFDVLQHKSGLKHNVKLLRSNS